MTRQPTLSSAIIGPAAWNPAEYADPAGYVVVLEPWQAELIVANATGIHQSLPDKERPDVSHLTAADFDLQELRPLWDRLAHDVLRGRGFCVLRGLPVGDDLASKAITTIAWFGISLQFGQLVPQVSTFGITR
jgi:hypothetical protein